MVIKVLIAKKNMSSTKSTLFHMVIAESLRWQLEIRNQSGDSSNGSD